jgi:hypothetical protein
MKHLLRIDPVLPRIFPLGWALAGALAAASACGPTDGGEVLDSGGSTTDVQPVGCVTAEHVYEHEEEFTTADGCVTYQCNDGALSALIDNRVTIAGDLDLPDQEAVDAQVCLGTVEGAVTISGPVTDLTPLSQLARIGGNLDITATDAASLVGLGGLAEVGGSLVIADNANLSTLSFQVYMSVFGDVTIQNNDALQSLAGAEFIGQCAACATALPPAGGIVGDSAGAGAGDEGGADGSAGQDAAPAGDEGGAEPQGGTFYGGILIADNDALTDIFAMSNLWYAWSDVRFRNNAALTSLADLRLTEVQADLEITDHAALPSADATAFASAIDVWGTTTVCGNLGGTACP